MRQRHPEDATPRAPATPRARLRHTRSPRLSLGERASGDPLPTLDETRRCQLPRAVDPAHRSLDAVGRHLVVDDLARPEAVHDAVVNNALLDRGLIALDGYDADGPLRGRVLPSA